MRDDKFPLMTIFGRTLHFISIEFEQELKKHKVGITTGEFVVLYRLFTMEEDTISQQNFATMLGKHKSVILRQIDVLEAKKLVARLADPLDRRKNMISLTKTGVNTLNRVLDIENKLMNLLTNGIPGADLETLKQTALKIQENALSIRKKK